MANGKKDPGRGGYAAASGTKRKGKGKKDDIIEEIEVRENLKETCGTCENLILDDTDISIMCDGPCDKWHHIECEEITEEEANLLHAGKRNINWFCNKCVDKVNDFVTVERETDYIDMRKKYNEMANNLEELQTTIEGLKASISKLETDNQTKCTPAEVNGMIKHSMKEDQRQIASTVRKTVAVEMARPRDKNMIIYRAPESPSILKDDNIKHDKGILRKLLAHCDTEYEDDTIEKIIRLGRKEKDKIRPILVCFKELDSKKSLFSNLKNLKEAPEELKVLSISHDYTPEEREENKRLREEAKEKEASDPEHKYIIRGPPWNREIIKVSKKKED